MREAKPPRINRCKTCTKILSRGDGPIIKLTIPGRPVGYYTQGKAPNWKRMNAYRAYKMHVQATCRAAGINLPLKATKEEPLFIRTTAYFENGVHPDPLNVHKGIGDALFWARSQKLGGRGKKSGDKHTGGWYAPPKYDEANPRVELEVTRCRK
jgi:hypothetical protein